MDKLNEINAVPASKAKRMEHVEGLRGLAILAIVTFHYLTLFPNGYFGVDIFLVISGYFLFRNVWHRDVNFSFGAYIKKKFVRLWPATICIAILCPILALVLLPYAQFWESASSAIATLIGCANIYYDYSVDGYFSAMNSIANPLVHAWYLSMIAQIYLLSGLLILFLRKRSMMTRYITYIFCMLISFSLYNLPSLIDYFSLHISFSTYYWSSGRFWIVLAGGFAPLLPDFSASPRFKAFIGFAALLTLVFFSFYMQKIQMPMTAELCVVACSIICVRYGNGGVGAKVLCSAPCAIMGKYSFSLYLTHWPVLVFFSFYSPSLHDDYLMLTGALACSVVSAFFFYHMVEVGSFKWVRVSFLLFRFKWARIAFISLFSIAFLLMLANSGKIYRCSANLHRESVPYSTGKIQFKREGICAGRLHQTLPSFRKLTYEGGLTNVFFSLKDVSLLYALGDGKGEPNFLLLGDSHAGALVDAFSMIARRNNWHGAHLNTYMVPLEDYYYGGIYCNRWDKGQADKLFEYLQNNPQISTVIFANYWKNRVGEKEYTDWSGNTICSREQPEFIYNRMRAFLLRMRASGKRVVLLTNAPTFSKIKNLGGYLKKHCKFGIPLDEEMISCSLQEYERDNGYLNSVLDKLAQEGLCQVVHIEHAFFKDGVARCIQDDLLFYHDQHHLSYAGAVMALEAVEEELREILGASPQSDNEQ